MIDIVEIVASIEASKKENHIEPSYAVYNEIVNEVIRRIKPELNQCVADGRLAWNKTLNSIAFSTKTE